MIQLSDILDSLKLRTFSSPKKLDSSTLSSIELAVSNSSSTHQINAYNDVSRFYISESDQTDEEEEEENYPEGGLDAWLTVLGSFLGLTMSFGSVNSIGAIETFISSHQLASEKASVVGWIFSIHICLTMLGGIFTGSVFDAQGPKIPIAIGGILHVSGIFITGNCTKPYQFILAFSILAAMGNSLQIPSHIGCISHYFNKKRGAAIGFATVGSNVGGVVFPLMLKKMYSELGFTWTMRIFAFILGALDICAFFLIKPRSNLHSPQKSPQLNNKQPDRMDRIKNYFSNTIDFKGLAESPQFLLSSLSSAFSEAFVVCLITYYGSYVLYQGKPENTAYILMTLNNAMGIFSRFATGILCTRFGNFNMVILMQIVATFATLVILLPFGGKTVGLFFFSVLYGLGASNVSMIPVCISQVSRVEEFGKRYATGYFVTSICCLVSIPLAGVFIGSNPTERSYDHFVVFCGILSVVASACWIISRWFAVKFRLCIY